MTFTSRPTRAVLCARSSHFVKKRVLQFIGSFHQGGSERQAVALSRLLKSDGSFDILAATLNNEGSLAGDMADAGFADIPEFKLDSFYDANFVRQVRKCAGWMREQKIDIIHTHDFYTNVFGMAAATLARVPVRIAAKRETGMRSRSQRFVERVAFSRAHAVVANSIAVRSMLTGSGVPGAKIRVIYNGLDLSRFQADASTAEVRGNYGLPESDSVRLVTLVANLRHGVKNIPMLLHAAKRVVETAADAHFVIAGEGPLETELREMATDLGIAEHVTFIGRCSDVPALLNASYACVLTSDSEGFSNSILEYMAAGRPVVTTNVGGAAEAVVEGQTGFLVNPGDEQKLAERLLELLDDPAKANRVGNAARERAIAKFSDQALLDNTLGLYNSLLDR